MTLSERLSRADRVVIGCCLFYFGLGALWIDKPGLQADEVLFTQPLFDPLATAESMTAFHHRVPLMLMSYLGCLKTLLYAPLIAWFAGSPPATIAAMIRLPMVAAGALSIWIVYRIVRRLISERAGLLTAILLATDGYYLLLTRNDWGPVTLQHLLTLSGVWALLRFYDAPAIGWHKYAWVGLGGFLFGLAMWDKTVFLWSAAALLAGAAMMWREIRPQLTVRRVALLLACFAIGAYPWIRHNFRTHGATFGETAHFSTEGFTTKAANFVDGLNGVMLLGYMVRERGYQDAKPPDLLAAAMVRVAKALNFPRRSLTGWAFLAALLTSPFLGCPLGRPARIVALMTIAGFLLMALTKGGGIWVYHSSILWPLPHVLIVLALLRLPTAACWTGLTVLVLAALALFNTHWALMHLYGYSQYWSDAIYQLPAALERHTAARPPQIIDWGLLEPVQLLTNGKLPIETGFDRKALEPGIIYVGHTAGNELFPDSNTRFQADAARAGCKLRSVEKVSDSFGLPMIELWVCD